MCRMADGLRSEDDDSTCGDDDRAGLDLKGQGHRDGPRGSRLRSRVVRGLRRRLGSAVLVDGRRLGRPVAVAGRRGRLRCVVAVAPWRGRRVVRVAAGRRHRHRHGPVAVVSDPVSVLGKVDLALLGDLVVVYPVLGPCQLLVNDGDSFHHRHIILATYLQSECTIIFSAFQFCPFKASPI